MMKSGSTFGLSVLILGGAMGITALAQSNEPPVVQTSTTNAATTNSAATSSTMNPADGTTYATGKPLTMESKEGFWGHVNPFARKKWVKRQLDPIKDRDNELDQLQAKNANDIRDVDSRSQAGIHRAMEAANTADQHAQAAASTANSAQTLAGTASNRTDALNTTVGNLDQYSEVTSASIPFAKGRTALGPKGKADLDDLATKLAGEKGYIVEVEGYSRGGVQPSQAMADSVVRYLVEEHQVPIYRIYRTGMGKNTAKSQGEDKALTNGVRVALMHNSLATMNNSASNAVPASPQTPQATSGVSAPPEQ
ncbi:OmpA family protein [Edaphobacter paludis]|uniref:OmpA family protein n=1 Tax=Edaphobacter paludis TaxID=3035702 RepID=A0AAU7D695_9BACT